jgi:hypothetical protein
VEANQKALELLETYKFLYQYVSRGESGEIIISEEGMDELINS